VPFERKFVVVSDRYCNQLDHSYFVLDRLEWNVFVVAWGVFRGCLTEVSSSDSPQGGLCIVPTTALP
jgi:hypothetical protein